MARREWTLWVANTDQTDLRHYRVSKDALRLAIAAAFLSVGFLGSALTRLWGGADWVVKESRLQERDHLLEAELAARLGFEGVPALTGLDAAAVSGRPVRRGSVLFPKDLPAGR